MGGHGTLNLRFVAVCPNNKVLNKNARKLRRSGASFRDKYLTTCQARPVLRLESSLPRNKAQQLQVCPCLNTGHEIFRSSAGLQLSVSPALGPGRPCRCSAPRVTRTVHAGLDVQIVKQATAHLHATHTSNTPPTQPSRPKDRAGACSLSTSSNVVVTR